MKQLTCTSVLLTFLFSVQSTMADTLDNQDLAFAFGLETPLAMQTLSDQEMVETEGAVILQSAGALVGGLGTTFGYWSSADNPTFVGTATAFFGGAAAGVINPIYGISTGARNFGGGFLGGFAGGGISNLYD